MFPLPLLLLQFLFLVSPQSLDLRASICLISLLCVCPLCLFSPVYVSLVLCVVFLSSSQLSHYLFVHFAFSKSLDVTFFILKKAHFYQIDTDWQTVQGVARLLPCDNMGQAPAPPTSLKWISVFFFFFKVIGQIEFSVPLHPALGSFPQCIP